MRNALRMVVLAAIGLGGMTLSLVPAHAWTPYHTVSYTPPKDAIASASGLTPSPSLDITGVSYGYNSSYLRFVMTLTAADLNPPTGFQQQDFIWRFSYGSVQAVVEYQRFAIGGQFLPDSIGTTTGGADTINNCGTCYATIDTSNNRALFYVSLDNFNAAIGQASPGAPPARVGTDLHLIEADTQADIGPGVESFPADRAPAPKGLTFTI